MSTRERGVLLHNMSAPPKSIVKYSGLADLEITPGPGGSGVPVKRPSSTGIFGTPVRFALPSGLAGKSPSAILRLLGVDPRPDPEQKLAALVNARAEELPLPGGCVVIPSRDEHRVIWADALSVLAVLAKCSDSIWLRAKTPAFNAALLRRSATLLVPPLFACRLPEVAS